MNNIKSNRKYIRKLKSNNNNLEEEKQIFLNIVPNRPCLSTTVMRSSINQGMNTQDIEKIEAVTNRLENKYNLLIAKVMILCTDISLKYISLGDKDNAKYYSNKFINFVLDSSNSSSNHI